MAGLYGRNGSQMELIKQTFVPMLQQGLLYSVPLALVSFAVGMVLAVAAALAIVNKIPVIRQMAGIYIWVFRGTPLLLQLFLVYWGICLPLGINKWAAGIGVFSLYAGACSAETIRAAVRSISDGQWEAGYAIGMDRLKVLERVILPQTVKAALSPLIGIFIHLVKDTALASVILLPELFQKAQEFAGSSSQYLLIFGEAAVIYLLFFTFLTGIQKLAEKKLRLEKC